MPIGAFKLNSIGRYLAPSGGFTPPTAAFTDDTNNRILLHFNGTNGATTTTDDNSSGRTARTMTMTTSSLSTAQFKFGTASATFDGTGGDKVTTTTTTADFDIAASGNTKTIEFWIYINSLASMSRNSPNHLPSTIGKMDTGGNINWSFGPNSDGGITFFYWNGGNQWNHSTIKTLTTGQWYHLAVTISGTLVTGYVNGVSWLSFNLTGTPTTNVNQLTIGTEYNNTINAYVDEVRISNVVRY